VVNLGVCEYSSLQGKILFEREGVRYQPDLVTLSYGSNDWSRVPEPFDVALRRNLGWTGAVRELLHLSRAYQIGAAFLTRAVPRDGGVAGAGTGAGAAGMPYNVGPEASRSNMAAMIERVRQAGADPVLVSNCVPGEMADPIRLASRDRQAPLVDSEAILRSAIPALAAGRDLVAGRAQVVSLYGEAMLREYPDLEVYLADRCHPNVVGQAILARAIADVVEASAAFRGGPRG
jgi:lysophospholipase L1-like esterase